MEGTGTMAFEVEFLTRGQEDQPHDLSLSSLDLSVGSWKNDEEETVGDTSKKSWRERRGEDPSRKIPCTPVAQRQTNAFPCRPTSLGDSEVTRRRRLAELCGKPGKLVNHDHNTATRDDPVASIRQLLRTQRSLRNKRGSGSRSSWRNPGSESGLLASSSVHLASPFRLRQRRSSLPRSFDQISLRGTGSGHHSTTSTRWANSSASSFDLSFHNKDGGSSHSLRLPQRSKSRDLPVVNLQPRPYTAAAATMTTNRVSSSGASPVTTAPRRPQRTYSRGSSFAVEDDAKEGHEDDHDDDLRIQSFCAKVLALAREDDQSANTVGAYTDTVTSSSWHQSSLSSRKDVPSRIPHRQRSNDLDELSLAPTPTKASRLQAQSSPTTTVISRLP